MSKHLADGFNGDSILKGDGRGEGVPGDVKTDFFLNLSKLGCLILRAPPGLEPATL